jgi:hypothetical protein
MLSALAATAMLGWSPVPDPRLENSYRKELAGWVYVHLVGKPRDIGYQYGTLLSTEIDDAHRALRSDVKGPDGEGWEWYRNAARELFWDKVDAEYQQEIIGQAEGLKAKGLAYDQWDVLAYNAHIELEGYYIPYLRAKRSGEPIQSGSKESCSAFVATGSATADGNIVLGHNLWWGYLMGQRANAMVDIKPEKGERVMFDAFCGMIHSGTDFAINSAGIALCETTIGGFAGFDPKGIPEFVRMRKAIQYSKNLSDVAAIFKKGNNGGYANTWLMGDAKTGEIGKLELGLKNVIFSTSTEGYYVGSNFPEDPKLIREEVPGGWNADPKRNGSERRRVRWCHLLDTNKGQVDAEKGKTFLADTYDMVLERQGASGSTLNGKGPFSGATNSKVVSADMVKGFRVWARMGFSDGSELKFTSRRNPLLRDIPSQPWVLIDPSKLK